MIEVPVLNRLQTANISHVLRWSILAWTLIFACSQSLASSHIHVDNHSDVTCTLCAHTDNTPIASTGDFFKVSAANRCGISSAVIKQWFQRPCYPAYLTRAPPQA